MEPNPYEPSGTMAGMPKTVPSAGGRVLLFAVGVAAMLSALFLQNVTLGGNSYRGVLILALVLTTIADVCLAAVVWRGPTGLRALALAAMGPTLWVLADLIRRGQYAF